LQKLILAFIFSGTFGSDLILFHQNLCSHQVAGKKTPTALRFLL